MNKSRTIGLGLLASLASMIVAPGLAQPQPKPNIVVIMGDDIGYWNISAYNRGQMGYRTPNLDRIANEGAIFTDYYGQQSCTAGRSAFVPGSPAPHQASEAAPRPLHCRQSRTCKVGARPQRPSSRPRPSGTRPCRAGQARRRPSVRNTTISG
jgi:hypothetical protein